MSISIHPPRVGRDRCLTTLRIVSNISIHPPRVGRDNYTPFFDSTLLIFQSTLPVWGGTSRPSALCATMNYFNPPSPCGEGPLTEKGINYKALFQSTLPVWGGTPPAGAVKRLCRISIHPPRVGRDIEIIQLRILLKHFNPPSPCGEGRFGPARGGPNPDFNPPSPCGEGQRRACALPPEMYISIHPPRVGRDVCR